MGKKQKGYKMKNDFFKLDSWKCPVCLYVLNVPAGQILMPFIKKCPKCNVELKKSD